MNDYVCDTVHNIELIAIVKTLSSSEKQLTHMNSYVILSLPAQLSLRVLAIILAIKYGTRILVLVPRNFHYSPAELPTALGSLGQPPHRLRAPTTHCS